MGFADILSLKRQKNDESQIQADIAPMIYEPDSATRRTAPRRKSLADNKRRRMNKGDKAIEFDRIAETYLLCENKFIEALRRSTMSIDEKLDLILKKRDECSQSQSDIVGGRRKRRRKTRRKKKRKSRRKSRKRKRKTKKRR